MKTDKFIILYFILIAFLYSNENGTEMDNKEPKVLGVGGIFFKTEDTEKTKKWYEDNLGIMSGQWGTMFKSRDIDNTNNVTPMREQHITVIKKAPKTPPVLEMGDDRRPGVIYGSAQYDFSGKSPN